MNTTTLEKWASDIVSVIRQIPGTKNLVQELTSPGHTWTQVHSATADRIQYALDDAGYTIDLLEDHMLIWKIEGKAIAIDWSDDEKPFPEVGFVDAEML